MTFEPRPYQLEARDFALAGRGCIIADAMRLGKTYEALLAWKGGPMFIAAPLSTRQVWLDWIERTRPGTKVAVLKGRTYDREAARAADVVFTHYDVLSTWMSAGARRFELVIFDEAHFLSNWRTKRSKAAAWLRAACERAILLTGTPLWNRPADLYNLLQLARPGAWGSFYDFATRFAGGHRTIHGFQTGNPTNAEELQRLMRSVVIRRTWNDVASQLPPIERTVEVVDLSVSDHLAIDRAFLDEDGEPRGLLAGLGAMRKVVASAKAAVAAEVATRYVDAGEPPVIWTWFKETAHQIALHLGGRAIVITGDDDIDTRERMFNLWRSGPPTPLVATMAIGQVGIDLSHGRHCIFAELDWTPAVMAQTEARTYSPLRPSTTTFLLADHPVERRVVDTLVKKMDWSREVGLPAAESALELVGEALAEFSQVSSTTTAPSLFDVR